MNRRNPHWMNGHSHPLPYPIWRTLLPEAVWREALLVSTPELRGRVATEICIIGAGLTGLSVAYHLARAGKGVVVLDAMGGSGPEEPRHFGESLRTPALLTQVVAAGYAAMIRHHGFKGAQRVAESHGRAIDDVEETIALERLECGFARVDASLFLAPGEPWARLERELHSAHMAGLRGAEWRDDLPIPGLDVGPGIRYPRQARLSPVPYLVGLRRAVERYGGRIFGGTRVHRLESRGSRESEEGAGHRVETAGGDEVLAQAVVIATHVPLNDRFAIHSKQEARRTHLLAVAIPRGSVPDLLLHEFAAPWPGHSIRVLPGNDGRDLLVVSGEDHRVGFDCGSREEASRWRRLEWWARERFPMAEEIVAAWTMQTLVTTDGIGFIGRKPYESPGVYVASGDNGIGLTHSAVAGRLLSDLILHGESPWEALYDPARFDRVFPSSGLGRRLRDIAEVALCYGDYLHGNADDHPVEALGTLAPGEGRRLESAGRQLACYRDEEGTLHCFSAVCPHMKGLVRWNATEKTWDCPCHGSRFDAGEGEVINGPATEGLAPAEIPTSESGKQSVVPEKVKKIAGKMVKGIQQALLARHNG